MASCSFSVDDNWEMKKRRKRQFAKDSSVVFSTLASYTYNEETGQLEISTSLTDEQEHLRPFYS